MGSHYIPVGKIKIDKDILDIVCPAAGYDETPPDPAIYCPANGFTEPEEVWESPVITPAPSNQEILLICSDFYEGGLAIRTKTTGGVTKVEILNSSMSVLSTFTGGLSSGALATINIDFPTIDTGAIYIIRLSPDNEGASFLEFRTTTRTGFTGDWMILEAKFNTPNMEKLEYAFNGLTNFKKCYFHTEMESLVSMQYIFSNSGFERVDGITYFPALTQIRNAFEGTSVKRIDLTEWYMPGATLFYAFQNSRVEEVSLSQTSGIIGNYTFYNTPLLKLNVPADYQFTATTLNYTFANTPNFKGTNSTNKSITIRCNENLTSTQRMFENSATIKEIIFEGTMDLCTNMSSMCYGCASLEELIMPSSMNAMNTTALNNGLYRFVYNAKRLKRLILPLSMSSWYLGWTNAVIPNSNIIEELGTCNVYSDTQQIVWLYGTRWKKISQPTLKLNRLIVGDSQTIACNDLQEFDFDFENSLFDPMPATAITLYTTNLTAAQLNALFHRLPDYTGDTVRKLNVLTNIGWNDSDKTILSAKNWTWA